MKFRTVVALAALVVFGLTQVADARPHARRHAAKKSMSGGVNTSTTDINGDGSPDAVSAPKSRNATTLPKTKPKSVPLGVSVQ